MAAPQPTSLFIGSRNRIRRTVCNCCPKAPSHSSGGEGRQVGVRGPSSKSLEPQHLPRKWQPAKGPGLSSRLTAPGFPPPTLSKSGLWHISGPSHLPSPGGAHIPPLLASLGPCKPSSLMWDEPFAPLPIAQLSGQQRSRMPCGETSRLHRRKSPALKSKQLQRRIVAILVSSRPSNA